MKPNSVLLFAVFIGLIALNNGHRIYKAIPDHVDLDDMEYDRDNGDDSHIPKIVTSSIWNDPVLTVQIPNKRGEFVAVTRMVVQVSKTTASSFEEIENVKFFLYRTNDTADRQEFQLNETSSILAAGFKLDLPTIILVHGWLGSLESDVEDPLAKAMLAQEKWNFIAVDWRESASTWFYPTARYRVPKVASLEANLIDNLVDGLDQDLDQIGIIGHSLGAHIAGIAGKAVQSGKIGYIVGLDPASPLFRLAKPDERLSADDAQYVEVIHTNGKALGFFENIGQADFYPNGGEWQPGCWFSLSCHHERAVEIFKELLKTRDYYARRCDDIIDLGPSCNETAALLGGLPWKSSKPAGVYYISTASSEPFLRSGTVGLKSTFFWAIPLVLFTLCVTL